MVFAVTHEDLALVLFGRRVDVGDHCRGVGDQDGVHEAAGHHADHHDPHLHIICRQTNRNRGGNACFFTTAPPSLPSFSTLCDGHSSVGGDLTCWCVHGSVGESNHLRESSENSPGVLHDHRGILGTIRFILSGGNLYADTVCGNLQHVLSIHRSGDNAFIPPRKYLLIF